MNALVFLALLAVAVGQFFVPWGSSHGDRIHGYSFSYHDNHHLLVIRNDNGCWLVEINGKLRDDMHHRDTREKIEDHLYQQILKHDGETPGDHDDIRDKYHDRLDSFRCVRHRTYNLVYTGEHAPPPTTDSPK